MISELGEIRGFSGEVPDMSDEQRAAVASQIRAHFESRSLKTPSQWCCENLIFDEPENRGPFTLDGAEYCREPLDSFADPEVTDGVFVFGSQTRKTGTIMGGVAYLTVNEPCRVVWALPNEQPLAQNFASTRWLPLLKKSPGTRALLPTGAQRHDVKTLQQTIGASIVNLCGSNSAANLSSTPARVAIGDEVDKFNEGTAREADADDLLDQRTKNFANPKRYKASTPTVIDGLIWQAFQKTDQRRRFVPCPFCGKFVVFAWSQQFSVLPLLGCEAFVVWDKEARRPDRSWDLDRVERSARLLCPHCGGHIHDGHKPAMDLRGQWRPTAQAARGFRGWHLSSLYSTSGQMKLGTLAVKFLQKKRSLLGLHGFINSELAEPFDSQDTRSERFEIVVAEKAAPLAADPLRILTVDHQLVSPFFWFVARDWYPGGSSRLVDFGFCEEWSSLREIQQRLGVIDSRVVIDNKFATATVHQECLRWGQLVPQGRDKPPIWVGWWPCRGYPETSRWKDRATGVPMIFSRQSATAADARLELPVLNFNGPAMKDILAKLRRGPDAAAGIRWELIDRDLTEYFRHLDAEYRKPVTDHRGRVRMEWTQRSRWPNHLLDCEVEQVAAAMFFQRLRWADALISMPDPAEKAARLDAEAAARRAAGRAPATADDSQLELGISA